MVSCTFKLHTVVGLLDMCITISCTFKLPSGPPRYVHHSYNTCVFKAAKDLDSGLFLDTVVVVASVFVNKSKRRSKCHKNHNFGHPHGQFCDVISQDQSTFYIFLSHYHIHVQYTATPASWLLLPSRSTLLELQVKFIY